MLQHASAYVSNELGRPEAHLANKRGGRQRGHKHTCSRGLVRAQLLHRFRYGRQRGHTHKHTARQHAAEGRFAARHGTPPGLDVGDEAAVDDGVSVCVALRRLVRIRVPTGLELVGFRFSKQVRGLLVG